MSQLSSDGIAIPIIGAAVEGVLQRHCCRNGFDAQGGFNLPLIVLEGFIVMAVPLKSPYYSCVSKRRGPRRWKMRKHGKEKRRVWRKLHLAVDAAPHAIVVAESCPAISGVES